MKLPITFVMLALLSMTCSAQLDFDFLIGGERSDLFNHYDAAELSKDSIRCSFREEEENMIVTLSKKAKSDQLCTDDSGDISYNIHLFYDEVGFCDKVEVTSNCVTCQNGLLDYLISNSRYRKWVQLSKNSYVSTSKNGSYSSGELSVVYYVEAHQTEDALVLTQKEIAKSDWKAYKKQLKRMDISARYK